MPCLPPHPIPAPAPPPAPCRSLTDLWISVWAASRWAVTEENGQPSLPVPVSVLQTRFVNFFSGHCAPRPPTASFVWPTSHLCCLPVCFGPDTGSATPPLLFINTSLSYLLPFPHLLAWPPPLTQLPTADVTTATSSNQVPTSVQLLRSAERHLPVFPTCPGGSLPPAPPTVSPAPLSDAQMGPRPLTHHTLSYVTSAVRSPGQGPSPGSLTTTLNFPSATQVHAHTHMRHTDMCA